MSSEIQDIIAELSVNQDLSTNTIDDNKKKIQEKKSMKNNNNNNNNNSSNSTEDSMNVSSSNSSDSVDLQSIERRLKALVHSAMHYDQK